LKNSGRNPMPSLKKSLKLIAEAYKAIDKTVTVGAMHRNTGNHRKSRLARRKKAIEILRGWYVPNAEPTAATT
jgi:small subunit ribosomal protein S20